MEEIFGGTAAFTGIDGGITTQINYGDEVIFCRKFNTVNYKFR